MTPRVRAAAVCAFVLFGAGCTIFDRAEPTVITGGETPNLIPPVPFVWSEPQVVDAMLRLARVGPQDTVYDLGCGDGRIVIAAAAKYGARGVGIDIDPAPLRFAVRAAEKAGVADRVRFIRGDFFAADLHPATVVTLYLSESIDRQLLPKLLRELSPGTRIVSHKFDFGELWPPQKIERAGEEMIYLWTVPERGEAVSP